jgi:hypothetical protein
MLRAFRALEPVLKITLALACGHLQDPAPYLGHGQRRSASPKTGRIASGKSAIAPEPASEHVYSINKPHNVLDLFL